MTPSTWPKCVREELARLSPEVAYPREHIRRGAARLMWKYGGLGFLEYTGLRDLEGRCLDRLTEKGERARELLMTIEGEGRETHARARAESCTYRWTGQKWERR